jgi:hypothetical protein
MRRAVSVILTVVAILLFVSLAQAKEFKLLNDESVPGAKGKVNVDKDKNGNYRLKVEVEHLAKPTGLTPPKQAYVVWVQTRSTEPSAIGQLRVNDNLKGTLEATAPGTADQFDVFITAEDSPNTQVPGGPRLLRATVAE